MGMRYLVVGVSPRAVRQAFPGGTRWAPGSGTQRRARPIPPTTVGQADHSGGAAVPAGVLPGPTPFLPFLAEAGCARGRGGWFGGGVDALAGPARPLPASLAPPPPPPGRCASSSSNSCWFWSNSTPTSCPNWTPLCCSPSSRCPGTPPPLPAVRPSPPPPVTLSRAEPF